MHELHLYTALLSYLYGLFVCHPISVSVVGGALSLQEDILQQSQPTSYYCFNWIELMYYDGE